MQGLGRAAERWLVLASLVTSACGGSSGKSPDAASTVDAPADAAITTLKIGDVAFLEQRPNGTMTTVSIAGFATMGVTISTRTDGPCTVTQKTQDTLTAVSAGAISISYGSGSGFILMPDAQARYSPNLAQGYQFTDGESISVSAAGAEVPAFSQDIAFPAALTVTSPTTLSTLSKSGFSATWTPTTSAVHIEINQYPDSIHSTSLDCTFAGADGQGSVPASALADLTAASTGSTSVSVFSETSAMKTSGGYQVIIRGDLTGFSASVTVQQ